MTSRPLLLLFQQRRIGLNRDEVVGVGEHGFDHVAEVKELEISILVLGWDLG